MDRAGGCRHYRSARGAGRREKGRNKPAVREATSKSHKTVALRQTDPGRGDREGRIPGSGGEVCRHRSQIRQGHLRQGAHPPVCRRPEHQPSQSTEGQGILWQEYGPASDRAVLFSKPAESAPPAHCVEFDYRPAEVRRCGLRRYGVHVPALPGRAQWPAVLGQPPLHRPGKRAGVREQGRIARNRRRVSVLGVHACGRPDQRRAPGQGHVGVAPVDVHQRPGPVGLLLLQPPRDLQEAGPEQDVGPPVERPERPQASTPPELHQHHARLLVWSVLPRIRQPRRQTDHLGRTVCPRLYRPA